MWEWIEFSFRVYFALLTAQLIIAVLVGLVVVLGVLAGAWVLGLVGQ